MISTLFNRRLWTRWATFAADSKGIYIANINFEFTYIPWSEVGETSVGYGWMGMQRVRSIILELNISDQLLNRIDQRPSIYITNTAVKNNYKKIRIGNQCRNVESSREKIEDIRRIAFSTTSKVGST